jgi:tryptophan synthase alpha chain
LDFIFLVTPETSEERVRQLDALSSGFLYAVSSSATTGKDQNMEGVNNYLRRLVNLQLKNRILVGFGIKDHISYMQVCEQAAGAIIGSAYIRALQGKEHDAAITQKFIHSILHVS